MGIRTEVATLTPADIDPIDPDGVVQIRFDWSLWLASVGVADITTAVFTVSAGLAVGDGVTQVSKKGLTVIPPAPSAMEGQARVYVWVDDAGPLQAGASVLVSCAVQAGQQIEERTALAQVRQL